MFEGNALILDVHLTQHDLLVQDGSHCIIKSQFIPFDDIVSLQSWIWNCRLSKNKHGTTISTEQEMQGALSKLIPRSEKVCRHLCLRSKYPGLFRNEIKTLSFQCLCIPISNGDYIIRT